MEGGFSPSYSDREDLPAESIRRRQLAYHAAPSKVRNEQIFPLVLLRERRSALLLDFDEGPAVEVLRDEIRALPVVAQLHRHEPIVRKDGRHFLKVVVFLLSGIQIRLFDPLQYDCHSYSGEFGEVAAQKFGS